MNTHDLSTFHLNHMDSNLHTRLAIITKNELGLAFPPRNLPKKFRPDPSTCYLVIVVTNRQTDKPTPVITCSPAKAFAGIKTRQFIFTHLYNSNLDAVWKWIDNSVGWTKYVCIGCGPVFLDDWIRLVIEKWLCNVNGDLFICVYQSLHETRRTIKCNCQVLQQTKSGQSNLT